MLGKLSIGSFGSEVHTLQDKLQQHGFEIPFDEVEREFFGPKTRDAICEFQRLHGLKISGNLDFATRNSLMTTLPNGNNNFTSAQRDPFIANLVNDLNMQSYQTTRPLGGFKDLSSRDKDGKIVFYVPLWKRKNLEFQDFYDYWRNVHGPLCARLPGQFQYWQFHLDPNPVSKFPKMRGVDNTTTDIDQFNGIAELTFRSLKEQQLWLQNSGILMEDEHNIFSKAIGYVTKEGNSHTYIDTIVNGSPNGNLNVIKFHVMVKQQPNISAEEFRHYMREIFANTIIQNPFVLKFRLHLFESLDVSRPDAPDVVHYDPPEKQFQAAYEIAFLDHDSMEKFFNSTEYGKATASQNYYVKQVIPFSERAAYTFVYDGQSTLAGERGSSTAALIVKIGATNQLKSDINKTINETTPLIEEKKQNSLMNNSLLSSNRKPQATMAQIFSSTNHYEASPVSNMALTPMYKNAVLDDHELQAKLYAVNPMFGDLCTRVAGEVWGLPLIDQKTKAFLSIAVDVVNQERVGGPLAIHYEMAKKQGATRAEIEELLLFMCAYAGFNKSVACFPVLDEVYGK